MWRFFDILSAICVTMGLLQAVFSYSNFICSKSTGLFFLTGVIWIVFRLIYWGSAWSLQKLKKLTLPKQLAVLCGILFVLGLGFGLSQILI